MKLELTEQEIITVIESLSRWRVYLVSRGEDDTTIKELLDKLRKK